jgi:hypothetical protein
MGDSKGAGAGLSVLAVVAVVVCCAGSVIISAGALAAVGTWVGSAIVTGVAALLVLGAVGNSLYRRRRGAHYQPAGSDSRDRHVGSSQT